MAAIIYKADGFDASNPIVDSGTGNDVTSSFTYTTGAALALLITDVIKLVKVPKGAIIFDWLLTLPDLDSATALTFKLGLLTQDDDCFSTANTGGRAGAIITPIYQAALANTGLASPVTPGVSCGIPLTVTCASGQAQIDGYDILALTVVAGATGAGDGGLITGWVRYNMRGQVF